MNNRIFYLLSLMCGNFVMLLLTGCSQMAPKTEETTTIADASVENNRQNNKDLKDESGKVSIRVSGDSTIWTSEENAAAEKIASEFVSDLKNKDMVDISKKALYPIEITMLDGQVREIANESDFSMLTFDEVFDKKFVTEMSGSKELFSNWRGYMLGKDSDLIWISPQENGEMKIYAIVTSNSQSDGEQE